MTRMVAIFAATFALSAAAAASASANTYCVPQAATGCTQAEPTIQQALDAAAAHPGPDAVKIAAGTFNATASDCSSYGFDYDVGGTVNSLTITGAGVTKTHLSCATGASDAWLVRLAGRVTISNLSIDVPGNETMTGLAMQGATARNIAVRDSPSSTTEDTGILAWPGTVQNATVTLPTSQTNNGIELEDGSTADHVSVAAGEDAISTYKGATISRAKLVSGAGVWADQGITTVYDTLIDVLPVGGSYNAGLLAQDNGVGATGAHVTVTARNTTIVGVAPYGDGVYSNAVQAGQTADITLTDSIINGPGTALARNAIAGATANVTTSYDDYPGGSYAGTGAGATTQSGPPLDVNPEFVNVGVGNFGLQPGSPLIDAGTPGGLAVGEPTTDLAGNPRILAGRGTCTARRDIGAYEFAPSRLPAHASASRSRARIHRSITFHATGCSIDPSLKPRFRWRFDDGSTAAGATVKHAFKRAGKHKATVTVSDPLGRKGVATVVVTVVRH